MSSILLSNPFVIQNSLNLPSAMPNQALSPLAVSPVAAMTGTDSAKPDSRSGTGGRPGSSPYQRTPMERPSDATHPSIVAAQAQAGTAAPEFPQSRLPKVQMPDPLPTSPFLAAMRKPD